MTYVGDTPLIKYDCGETITDLSTTPKLYYTKPSGTSASWDATLSTQYAQYQTVSGDIDESGVWQFQPVLSDGTKTYYGVIVELYVYEPISLS